MKKVMLTGAAVFALGLMSFNFSEDKLSEDKLSEDKLPKDCIEYAEIIEHDMTEGGCSTEIYNMAYNYCMDKLLILASETGN